MKGSLNRGIKHALLTAKVFTNPPSLELCQCLSKSNRAVTMMIVPRFFPALALWISWWSVAAALFTPRSQLDIRTPVKDHVSQPIPPRQDPWYTPPARYQDSSPGAILRIRSAPGNITAVVENCSAAYNILFRTTNSYSQPAFAVTTVFLPLNKTASKRPRLLSYQFPYNTADVDGSPSYSLSYAPYPDIPAALGHGWVVSVPDFEGPLASFLMGLTEGRAVLDAVRSVLSHEPFGLDPNATKTALWGYSGGSIASAFAIELQAQYAPELTLHGAAIGGTLPNIAASVLPLANNGPQAGLIPAAFVALTSQSSTARELLTSSLHPNNASSFMNATNLPLQQLLEVFATQDITSYFTNYSSFLYSSEIQAIQRENWHLGNHGVPQVPIFMYKAINDEIAPVGQVDDLVYRWCSLGGVDIRYERNRVGGHTAELYNGVARARRFLSSVLDGAGKVVPVHGGCSVHEVTVGPDVSPV